MKGDFLVDTPNPKALDDTLQQLGAVLIGRPDFVRHGGHYVVRPLAPSGFVRFAVEQQGYAKVVGDAPDPAPWDLPYQGAWRTVWDVLDAVVAEWTSDPMSVQCFDLRLVERAKQLLRERNQLFARMERDAFTGDYIFRDCRGDRWRLRETCDPSCPFTIEILERR